MRRENWLTFRSGHPHLMPNPGGFAGSRLKFLENELPEYTKAVANNRDGDFLLDLLRRFFKRYPMELEDNVEPTEETLASVNDEEPDEEPAQVATTFIIKLRHLPVELCV
ncbi:uncharacterized protein LACBIDRAFT_306861 [Laccaria bicolor S238N-H82]|uniref:Predicted protein n=1 Tax=Laccaria bicolor (strain S238N-H82 / ATCC MYA-4686) TaxID=486041 RepID=B0DNW2_LACBS|nr:uncharacterized protein LACBIDRAFT_306861 [Laccaria bicolor S238N-H82]EDR03723.1 predicted protein [Laccaria bicolor S238N-H82]|eukprot:XP_001885576.1 predicted protein [Laccaria bicolor S238N-H82]